jgi:hypothetical protein
MPILCSIFHTQATASTADFRIKTVLTEKGVFSYPMLKASYHYGMDCTAGHGFDMSRVPSPSDPVSYKVQSGDLHPLHPPK